MVAPVHISLVSNKEVNIVIMFHKMCFLMIEVIDAKGNVYFYGRRDNTSHVIPHFS